MISVIVSTYSATPTLGSCLDSLVGQIGIDVPVEIIIVDGGSSEHTLEKARSSGARIIQYQGKNMASSRNEAIREAKGEIICFTNGDCIPEKDWLSVITRPLSNAGIIGCKGTYMTSQRNMVARFIQLEYEEKYDRLQGVENIDFIDGYSAAYRRSILEINDGFDERLPRLEDEELSYRLASRGYKMVFVRAASVRHSHFTRVVTYWRSKFQTAFWKSQIVRKFPDRAHRDSYTPQLLKIQMLLVTGFLFSLLLFVASSRAYFLTFTLLLIFLFSTLPFMVRAWQRDQFIAIVAPFFLAVRATALTCGYFLGAIRFITKSSHQAGTISGLNYLLKRGVDLTGGILGLAVFLLFYPVIGLSIRLTSAGPVIYSQERIGRGGQTFTMYKFRSMVIGAGSKHDQLIIEDRPEYKSPHDPRITLAGRFLRRWSLDELPEFWNVIKGDMSLVGPRPEETAIVAKYSDHHRLRLTVKPGITGPMQVSGRADLALNERVFLEVKYIEDYSLIKDFVILAQTIPAVLQGRGAR
ncbi:MAG TPA: sugar transferase [candidate division Zixibacteria bacterium]|nr:sugar transferase [candidate division Zixibacteria bacterium]